MSNEREAMRYFVTSAISGTQYVFTAQSWRHASEKAEAQGIVVAGVEIDTSDIELREHDDFVRGEQ